MLFDYITSDALLGKFFEVFIFENIPALNDSSPEIYLDEVKRCDIYLGLFGKSYGYEDADGISPTEHEFNCARDYHKTKLIYITSHTDDERHPKELKLIQKAEEYVIRKKFSNELALKASVYNSLVRFLEENEYIRTLPFDATFNRRATIDDLDIDKIRNFVYITQAVNFVLSNIASSVGVRDSGAEGDVEYEIPIPAITEAIVNAVAHRDYTSNGSIQVMLFKDRLEIWNPGHLPLGLTVAKLKEYHHSIPVNPLIAEPMYLNGTIERMGTGTRDIIQKCLNMGLREPAFYQEEFFRVVLWRESALTPPQ